MAQVSVSDLAAQGGSNLVQLQGRRRAHGFSWRWRWTLFMSEDGLYLWFICWIMFLCFIFWRGKPFHLVEGKIFLFYIWWMMYFLIKTKHIWRCLNIFDDDDDNDDVTVMGLRDTFIWNLALLRQTRQRHLTCETKQLLASGDTFRAGWTCLQDEFVIIRNHKSQQLILDPHGFALTAYDLGTWPINSKKIFRIQARDMHIMPIIHTRVPFWHWGKLRSLFWCPSWQACHSHEKKLSATCSGALILLVCRNQWCAVGQKA